MWVAEALRSWTRAPFLLNGFCVIIFPGLCPCVFTCVPLHSGCDRRAAARLVRLQSGKLEEKTLCFAALQSMLQWEEQPVCCYRLLVLGSCWWQRDVDFQVNWKEFRLFEWNLIKMHPESTSWAKPPLFWGEGKRDDVFRNFLELKTRLYIHNYIFVWKKDSVHSDLVGLSLWAKSLSRRARKEAKEERKKKERMRRRMTARMTLKTKCGSCISRRFYLLLGLATTPTPDSETPSWFRVFCLLLSSCWLPGLENHTLVPSHASYPGPQISPPLHLQVGAWHPQQVGPTAVWEQPCDMVQLCAYSPSTIQVL